MPVVHALDALAAQQQVGVFVGEVERAWGVGGEGEGGEEEEEEGEFHCWGFLDWGFNRFFLVVVGGVGVEDEGVWVFLDGSWCQQDFWKI